MALSCLCVLLFTRFAIAAEISTARQLNGSVSTRIERSTDYDYFVTGDPNAPRAAQTGFLLALMGGGGSVDAAFAAIAERAGHGHIVILRAVSDGSFDPEDGNYGESFITKWGPVTSAETLVFHNRDASHDPRVLAVLRGADGIFIAGGDQANYIRYWKGTPVEETLNAHVKANRPIGGSSAGLAILGHYSYTALDGGSMESKVALANPYDPGVTLESDFLHLKWMDNVITDTHFSARCRLGRLIVFVSRINRDHPGVQVVGVGVDEHTALLVGPDGVGELAQGSQGGVWIVRPSLPPKPLTQQPLTARNLHIVEISPGGSVDFKSWRFRGPSRETVDSIEDGAASRPSFASRILFRTVVPEGES